MSPHNKRNTEGILHICILYRNISLVASTLVYLFFSSGPLTLLRAGVAAGMIISSSIGTYLYKRILPDYANTWILVAMCVEIVAYGLFLFLSGGFASPYLWYFVSALTIMMATQWHGRRYRLVALLSVIWCLACAYFGRHQDLPDDLSYAHINTAIGFLIVAAGFYILFAYAWRLNQNKQELAQLNETLQQETKRSEQALRHTIDLYDTFQLFGITDPSHVMAEMAKLVCRVMAAESCLLVKTNSLQQIEITGSHDLTPQQEAALLEQFAGLESLSFPDQWPAAITVAHSEYAILHIRNLSGVAGALLMPLQAEDKPAEQKRFYLRLIGIILHNLDLQDTVEAGIISGEQNRIANEIHDTVIQKLFAIACNVRLLMEQQATAPSPEITSELQQILKGVESTMKELREAIYSIRWESGGREGFTEKLGRYMEEVQALTGAKVQLSFAEDTHSLNNNQKTVLYRIVCEAVNNAIRHGKAGEIHVSLGIDGDEWVAEINDNGTGFDKSRVAPTGQGLKNMRWMAGRLMGRLLIDSKPGSGTVLRCHLPQ